jgi:tetratricopeptide (TPR) repeat protein
MAWIRQLFWILAITLPAAAADSPAALLAQGRADDAVAALQKQLQNSPNDASAQNLLCRAYYSYGNWDRAVSACEKAVSLEPGNATYHLWLGRAYGEKADNSNFFSAASLAGKVRTEFEKAVELAPEDAQARSDLSEFYVEAPGMVGGGKDKAVAQAQALEEFAPAKAHWVRAEIARKNKDNATAEKEYRAAIEASHGNALAWGDLASFFRKTDRLDDMEKAIDQAIKAEKNEPEVFVESADMLIRAGRNFPLAARLLHRYLDSDSKVEEAPAFRAHYLLGSILEKQGDKKAAAQEYQAALALAKDYSRAKDALKRVSR